MNIKTIINMKMKYRFVLLISVTIFLLSQSVAQNSSHEKIKGENSKVKVFLLGGQSNMSGWTPLSEVPVELRRNHPEVLIWIDGGEAPGSVSRRWMSLIPGLGKSETFIGPELSFGPELAQYFPDEKIALLKYSYGGTDLVTHWRPPSSGETTGFFYEGFIKSVYDGLASLPVGLEPEIAGMIWMQGESDANQTKEVADEYEFNLTNLIHDIRSEFNVPEMPFVIGQISEALAWDAFGSTIRKTQSDLGKKLLNTSTIITTDLGFTDQWHYNGIGEIMLGERFASSVYNIIMAKGLKSQLFNTNDLQNPNVTRVDSLINFNWGSSSPDKAISEGAFSVKWAGYLRSKEAGVHTFYVTTTNSVKLWVDDVLIIDGTDNNIENTLSGEIQLNAETYYSIKVEFVKNSDNASIALDWSFNGNSRQPVPSTVLYQNPLHTLDKSKWSIKSCDSQIRTAAAYGGAKGTIDNNFRSYWKTVPDSPFPHEIAIDLNDTLNIAALDYVPNQLDSLAGNALLYNLFTSINGTDWLCVVDSGVWRNNTNLKTVRFMPVVARYVKLQILSSSRTSVSAADISLHGTLIKPENKVLNTIVPLVNEKISVLSIPSSGYISIKLNDFGMNDNVELSFYNAVGQSVYHYKMGTNRDMSFDCRQILKNEGVYILVVNTATGLYKKKFLFNHYNN